MNQVSFYIYLSKKAFQRGGKYVII